MENNKEEGKKKKTKLGGILLAIVFLLACGAGGWFMGSALYSGKGEGAKPGEILFVMCFAMLTFYLTGLLQIVVHEAGHLVCGLLTGYRFSSFRIGSFMWIKEDGKIRLKRYSVAGTGGQCLMAPPDLVDGKMPYVWYNLGGALANLLLSAICTGIAFIPNVNQYVKVAMVVCAIIGVVFALINGLPLNIPGAGLDSNDGNNAKNLGKEPEALRAFWLQMKMNEEFSHGKRLKDLPEEWFDLPKEEGMHNSMIASIAVFRCNLLIDKGKYAEADALMKVLLEKKNGIVEIHRQLLMNDRIYCEIVGENREEELEQLMTKEHRNFRKNMKKSLGVLRTEYVYQKFVKKDDKLAEKAKQDFEKVVVTYPYAQDVEAERELIAYAEEKYKEE